MDNGQLHYIREISMHFKYIFTGLHKRTDRERDIWCVLYVSDMFLCQKG